MKTYNGHKNWNHWNVSLWINNDEGLYQDALWAISCGLNRDSAVELFLELRGMREEFSTPDGARYSKSAVRAAMVGM